MLQIESNAFHVTVLFRTRAASGTVFNFNTEQRFIASG
jgi:hypothetical protein